MDRTAVYYANRNDLNQYMLQLNVVILNQLNLVHSEIVKTNSTNRKVKFEFSSSTNIITNTFNKTDNNGINQPYNENLSIHPKDGVIFFLNNMKSSKENITCKPNGEIMST